VTNPHRAGNDDETFTRLYHFGRFVMGMSENEFWLMPIGLFLDLWACHKQWLGLEKPAREQTIDDVVPV
jgi:hypothetical protein